jgi:hypothetical protein
VIRNFSPLLLDDGNSQFSELHMKEKKLDNSRSAQRVMMIAVTHHHQRNLHKVRINMA